jgi:quinoprotein glucose dehydrogenase
VLLSAEYNRSQVIRGVSILKASKLAVWAINANTCDVARKIQIGTILELDAKGIHGSGSLNFGGPIATAGGLLSIAASNDQFFHAYDFRNGELRPLIN